MQFIVDNYIQDPTNNQNFNRYSYCLNNPLKYVDPSGHRIRRSASDAWASETYERWIEYTWHHYISYAGGSSKMGTIFGSDGEINYGGITGYEYAEKAWAEARSGGNAGRVSNENIGAIVDAMRSGLNITIIPYKGSLYVVTSIGEVRPQTASNGGLFSYNPTASYFSTISGSGATNGGDGYSVWQNAAEKSGYASSTLGGFGNIVYSEYKGVERWVGKNGNYYNSAKVRMNGGYARSAQLAKSASMTYKIAGHSMTALSVGFTAVEFAYSDKSGGDYARLISAGIGVGLGFVPVVGPGLAIFYGIADSAGAFDGIYDYFDQ